MAERSIALAILGIVAVIAVVGLVLLFTGALTGKYVLPGIAKVYPGKVVSGETGVGFDYLGEGAYAYEQKGNCFDYEFFTQSSQGSLHCRAGEARVEVYQRHRKFAGAPDQTYVVDGYCCTNPNFRAEDTKEVY